MTPTKTRGIYLSLLTAGISGVSIFLNKFAVTSVGEPLVFTTIKNLGVAFILLASLLASRKWLQFKTIQKQDWLSLLLIGVIGGSIPFYLFFTGLSTTPAITGAVIQKTLVVWVALLAVPFLKERLSVKAIVAVIALFLANGLVGGFRGFKFSSGEFLILLSTLFWASETILVKKILPRIDPQIAATARMSIGGLTLLIISLITRPEPLSRLAILNPTQLAWVGLTTGLLFAYVTSWYQALKHASAITVTAILVASTIVTNLLSAIFITHSLNASVIIQSLIIITSLLVITKLSTNSLDRSSSPNL